MNMKRKIVLVIVLCLAVAALGIGAAPGLAADDIEWQVMVGDPPLYVEVNFTDMYWTDVDAGGAPFTAVPANVSRVGVGQSTAWVTRGNTQVFAKAYLQRMQVWDPTGKLVIDVDETTAQGYWTAPYRWSDWGSPYDPPLPYNPRIGGGMMWAIDWIVPLPLPEGSATYAPGTYIVSYSTMLRHTVADPMFPGRVPGGEGYPPIVKPWDWEEPSFYTFEVE